MAEKRVRMCQECPFADEDEQFVYCGVEPSYRGLSEAAQKWPMATPEWCPLRSSPILVVFSEPVKEALDVEDAGSA